MDLTYHIQLTCPAGAEEQSRAYYCGLLRLVELTRPPSLALRGGCWFQGAGFELRIGPDPCYHPGPAHQPCLISPDLDGLAARLGAAGYPIIWTAPGPAAGSFRSVDPYGNQLEFTSQEHWDDPGRTTNQVRGLPLIRSAAPGKWRNQSWRSQP